MGVLSVIFRCLLSIKFKSGDSNLSPGSLFCILCALLLGAGFFLHRGEAGLNRLAIEDALEYYVGAENFVKEGSYSFEINSQQQPSRFPPFFSTVILAPFIDLGRLSNIDGPTMAYVPVLLMTLVALSAGFLLGASISNVWGGIAALLGCLLLPELRYFSGQIMTDAPFAALWLVGLLCFLMQLEAEDGKQSRWVIPGLIVAGAFGLRPLGIMLLVPWIILFSLQSRGRKLFNVLADLIMLVAPTVILTGSNLAYNRKVFGEPFRTGYHYWMSIPYDFSELTFSLRYVAENLTVLAGETAVLPALFVIAAIVVSARRPELEAVFICNRGRVAGTLIYLLIPGLGLILFHAVYFYSASRFFLPVSIILMALAAGLVGGFLNKLKTSPYALILSLGVAGMLARAVFVATDDPATGDLRAVLKLKDIVPPTATLVSAHNPLFLEHFVNAGTQRRLIPWSRELPYASKLITLSKPPAEIAAGAHWSKHRFKGLNQMADTIDPYPVVMKEAPRLFAKWLKQKRLVYVDTSLLSQEDLEWVTKHFFVTRMDNGLLYLRESCLRYE